VFNILLQGRKEKMIDTLTEQLKNSDVEECIKKFILTSKRNKYIFGGGCQARVLVDVFRAFDFYDFGIIISNKGFVWNTISADINIYHLEELTEEQKKDAIILIGINERKNQEIEMLLKNEGFKTILFSSNWNKTNRKLREMYFEYYLQRMNVINLQEEIRYEDKSRNIDLKIAKLSTDEMYMSMLISVWNDIIAPSIFDDYSLIIEGAYELGGAFLQPGDTVFDLGANIGIFSCVAAAKGCKVYAFEPTEEVCKRLEYNKYLNPNIEICKYAVGNENTLVKFYENPLIQNFDTGQNSIFIHREGYVETEVEEVTLDTYVEENHIERVDFIKADIEGAERNMLQGAQGILRKFAPKLALCTYHLPDDPEVMEKLILQANSQYIIEHRWKKLYAYVPKR